MAIQQIHNDLSTHQYTDTDVLQLTQENLYTQSSSFAIHIGFHQDPGIRRKSRPNEDTLFAMHNIIQSASSSQTDIPFVLLLVADGMGGLTHGQEASRLAARVLITYVSSSLCTQGNVTQTPLEILSAGMQYANQVIYERIQQQQITMGTTTTAVLIIRDTAFIAHVGDSRLYLYHEPSGLTQITHDHSLVAALIEAGVISPDAIYTHPKRHYIYRFLGEAATVEVETKILPLSTDDQLLLCSDGLWEMVRDQQIASILTTPMPTPTDTAYALIQEALNQGGDDNVSAIVAHVCSL